MNPILFATYLLGLLALSFRVERGAGVFKTATVYGADSSTRNDALEKAGQRQASKEDIGYFKDKTASFTPAAADVVKFGPFPRGSVIIPSSFRLQGDGTTDLGDDVNIGYAPVTASDGSADDNAYDDAADLSVGNIGVNASPVLSDHQIADVAPDFDYWVTLTIVDDTGAAAGTLQMECSFKKF